MTIKDERDYESLSRAELNQINMDEPLRDEEMRAGAERSLRHMQATHASDIQHLRDTLKSAADRFDDIAALLEKDRSYDPVHFMRASAIRCRLAADGKS